ncbi:trifunctional purine biosynthetic protein adenosine-3-like [Spea bombifrons]|uniref:trifunctional purine biosynthetic protein adenosine-3-like n=1 Tax=Spea bombifrons TaxID=233779 RepID=UPI00234B3A54|nr:trifunctional purine biosynthetic protein adenosine-3-like [Spea bombifrons]
MAYTESNGWAKLKQLIDSTRLPGSCTRLGLIISNKTTAGESKKAAGAGIPTRVIDQTFFGCHSEFEFTISKVLEEFSIDLVCFVGFRRTLSDQFVNKWKGKLLSAYPWLSPALSVERVLQTKLKVSGCTICFTLEGCVPGPTVLQETVTVQTGDTEVTLSARMEDAQQRAVTKALLLVASGIVSLPAGGSIHWRAQD